MPESAGKILVIRGGAIGDFILTLPVLTALRAAFPRARLELLGYEHIAALAQFGGLVDAVRPIEARPLAAFFARDGTLDPAWQDYFAGFAIILSYLYDPDGIFESNVRRCTRGQFIAGPHRPHECSVLHATDAFLKPLERLTIFEADAVPRLQAERTTSAAFLLAAHPGSGSEKKNWPEPRWAELLQELASRENLRLLLVGGEAEAGRCERLTAALPSDRVELATCQSLPVLARRLAGCSAFLGHDSGITHLAAALGLPLLALWGESIETVWRPRGERVALLRAGAELSRLPVEEVRQALDALLNQEVRSSPTLAS